LGLSQRSGVKSCFKSERRLGRKWPKVKTERNFGTGPDRNRIKEVLAKQQASSDKPKLDKQQAVGYYRTKQKGIK